MRVITGTAKGKNLKSPDFEGTRPTLDRVKEAIFGSIQFELEGSTCLDLFGGSGSMGIEAASRGAEKVYINDLNRKCIECIHSNVSYCNLSEKIEISQFDFKDCLSSLKAKGIIFNIIFIDSPFQSDMSREAVEIIMNTGLLSKNGCIIVEHDWNRKPEISLDSLCLRKQKKFGTCGYTIFGKVS